MDNCFSAYHVLTMATQGKTNKLIYFNLYPQINISKYTYTV